MKKILTILVFVLFACVGFSQQYVMTDRGYIINGQIKKGSGYATLRTYLPDGNESLDSTVLDKKGKFVFRGNVTEVMPALLTINGKMKYRIYLEPSLQMSLEVDKKKDTPKIKDAPQTLRWYDIVNPRGKEDYNVYLSRLENWVVNNPEDIFTCDIVASYLSHYWSYDDMDRHLNTFKGKAVSGYYYKHLRHRDKELAKVATGSKVPEISLPDVKGHRASLYSTIKKNKYTLIDFWATWSDKSDSTLEAHKHSYVRFKDKGFGIYSVSLDNNTQLWQQTVKDNDLQWTNVCDNNSWDAKVLDDYMIKSLSDNVLVDSEGKIVAKNLGITDLNKELETLLQTHTYILKGNIQGLKDGVAKLTILKQGGEKETYNARINNNKFVFSGSVDRVCMAIVSLPLKDGDVSFFMGNDEIEITGNKKDLDNVSVKGSESQDDFQHIADKCNRSKNPMQCLSEFVLNNPGSIYSPFILSNYLFPYMSDKDKQQAFLSLEGEALTMFQYSLLEQQFSEISSSKNTLTEKVTDFTLENDKGQPVSLYGYIKTCKYTLISFWASWDNNSRTRNIEYLRFYKACKRADFNIISVSLDDSRYAWTQAVATDGIGRWTNVSDLKKWNSSVVRLYNIKAVPYNILVDREGNIVGKDLTLEEISTIVNNK